MDELRARRVAEAMREELSELIRFEMNDPRVEGVEVTEVIASADMKRADVLVVVEGEEREQAAALEGLAAARHFLRRNLMQRMDLFRMPELRFRAAAQIGGGAPLDRLKRRMKRGRPRG